MNLTRYEQETIVNFNEEEKTASVYTHNKALIRKLKRLSDERPEECRLNKISHWGQAMDYTIPKSWVRITPTRILSEAQRETLKRARFAIKSTAHAEDSKCNDTEQGSYTP